LRRVLGLWVEEWVPYADGAHNRIRFAGQRREYSVDHWCDLVHLEGAKAVAQYTGDFFAGRPAITEHSYGRGAAIYLGTRLDVAGWDTLMPRLIRRAKLSPPWRVPTGVEITWRYSPQARFLFALNHSDQTKRVALGQLRGSDLLSGAAVSSALTLEPLGAAIIRLPPVA
jgi:beta-galactosidase